MSNINRSATSSASSFNSVTPTSKEDTMNKFDSLTNRFAINADRCFTGVNSVNIAALDNAFDVPVFAGAERVGKTPVTRKERFVAKQENSPFVQAVADLESFQLNDLAKGQVLVAEENPKLVIEGLGLSYRKSVVFHKRHNGNAAAEYIALDVYSAARGIAAFKAGVRVLAYGNSVNGWGEAFNFNVPSNAVEGFIIGNPAKDTGRSFYYKTTQGFSNHRWLNEASEELWDGTVIEGVGYKLGGHVKSGFTGQAHRHNCYQVRRKLADSSFKMQFIAFDRENVTRDDLFVMGRDYGRGVNSVNTKELAKVAGPNWVDVLIALCADQAVVFNGTWLVEKLYQETIAHLIHNVGFGWGVARKAAYLFLNNEDYRAYLSLQEAEIMAPDEDIEEA